MLNGILRRLIIEQQDKLNDCEPTESPRPGGIYLDYQDVNCLQNLKDTLIRLEESLGINKAAVEMWKTWAERTASHLECRVSERIMSEIDDSLRNIDVSALRMRSFRERVDGVMSTVCLYHCLQLSL